MMRKWTIAAILSVMLILAALPASGQDTPLQCGDTDDLVPVLAGLVAQLETPDENLLAALVETQTALAQFQADCLGLSFSGVGQQVIGPVTFPDGFYRVRLEIEPREFAIGAARLEEIDGDCDFVSLLTGDNDIGESAHELTGCVALIDVTAAAGWTLNFELLAAR